MLYAEEYTIDRLAIMVAILDYGDALAASSQWLAASSAPSQSGLWP
jgi:hypothetical protein